MADFETRVKVSAKTQGFDKIQQESAKLQAAQKALFQATKQGFSDSKKAVSEYQKLMGNLEDQLQETAKAQLELQEAIMETEKGSDVYKKLADELKRVDQQSNQVRKTIGLVEAAYRKEAKAAREAADASRAARGAFTQGFVQGAGVGEFMQRGPGMLRQAAGRVVGRATVGIPGQVAGGLARSPFQGAGALTGAMGIFGAPMAAALGYAGQRLEFNRAQMGLAPLLGGVGMLGGPSGVGGRAAARAGLGTAEIAAASAAARARGEAGFRPSEAQAGEVATRVREMMEFRTGVRERELLEPMGGAAAAGRIARGAARKIAAARTEEFRGRFEAVAQKDVIGEARRAAGEQEAQRVRTEMEKRRAEISGSAERAERQRRVAPFERAGRELGGMALQETQQFAGQLLQRGGSREQLLGRGGFLRAGVAAQTAFGVGADVSGAFMGAARRGGVVGGTSADQFAATIGDAVSLGLEGAEITEYMQQMAEGIEQWRNTGIPLNTKTVTEMVRGFGATGVGSVQAQRLGAGIRGRAQQVAMEGPGSAMDLMMLQTLGGFKGGGAGDLLQARERLEEGQFEAKDLDALIRKITEAAGPEEGAGIQITQRALSQVTGGPVSLKMARQMFTAATGGQATPEMLAGQQEILAKAKGPKTAEDVERLARENLQKFGGGLKTAADLQRQALETGGKLLPVMQDFEKATRATAETMGVFAPEFQKVSTAIKDLAETLPKFAEKMRSSAAGWLLR